MSEIKGQLLGIVLVVAVFGVVGGILVAAFQSSAGKIQTKIEQDYEVGTDGKLKEKTTTDKTNSSVNNFIISNDNLLTF